MGKEGVSNRCGGKKGVSLHLQAPELRLLVPRCLSLRRPALAAESICCTPPGQCLDILCNFYEPLAAEKSNPLLPKEIQEMLLQGSKWRAGGNHATSLGGDIRRIILLVQLLQHGIVAVARHSRHCSPTSKPCLCPSLRLMDSKMLNDTGQILKIVTGQILKIVGG